MAEKLILPGEPISLKPGERRVIRVNWDTLNLATTALIGTSTFSVTAIAPVGSTGLELDNAALTTDGRSSRVRLVATNAIDGQEYEVTNQIDTDETPAQRKIQSILVNIRKELGF